MAAITSLPNEVIVIILEKLSIKDIENFSSTCKKFRQTARDNKLWIKKFYQRWPTIKAYDSIKREDYCQIDFKERVKATVKFSKEMWELVSHIYKDKLDDTNRRDLVSSFICANVYSTNYLILLDEFERLFSQSARKPGYDLTRRFYSCFIVRLLKHCRAKFKCRQFINEPKEQQFLEQIVTIVVQWFRPCEHIFYTTIITLLNIIARKVWRALREQCPTHPIFAIPEYHIYWAHNNIVCSYWNYEEILPILSVTEKIIFSKAYFHKLNKLWLRSNLNDSQDVNHISAGSQSIFLLTIYHSIMRRFGIYSFLVSDIELQLFLKPKDNTKSVEYYCLKLTDGQFGLEHIMRTDDRSRDERDYLQIITILIERLKGEIVFPPREVIMLQQTIKNEYVDISDEIMSFIELTLKRKCPEERSEEIKFVVGTIVTHRCNNETHIGVIVGWNHSYQPLSTFGNTYRSFPVIESNTLCKNLMCTDSMCCTHKPYYSILCENNMYCYTEQENVSQYDSPKWIAHQEIGRYFCRYKGNYYLPNEMLARDYPSDIAIINEMRRNQ